MTIILTIYLTGAITTSVTSMGMDKFHPKYTALQHVTGGLLWPVGLPITLVLLARIALLRRSIRKSKERTGHLLGEMGLTLARKACDTPDQ